ncbi:hypothetical protein BJY52DRAFT_1200381 [Lactarius psammicola]|nr:hypothetical protein BJY52DRAFT_1200381 [Lactarius psammicola]
MSEVVVGQRGERSNSKSKAPSQIHQKKATSTQLDSIHNDEEFSLWGIEDNDDTPNAPGPSDHAHELVPWGNHLTCFIVTDDQSIHVVKRPEFQRLYMLLRKTLINTDIPRHDKMREVIISLWQKLFKTLKLNLSHSSGQISFTSNVWSNTNLAAYLALTAHWISKSNGRLVLKAALIGFHHLKKKHMGVNLAKMIEYLLDWAGVRLNISHFTLNNTKNNTVAMQELQFWLGKREMAIVVNFNHLNHCV